MSIPFNRFKKKSLILVYKIYPEDMNEILNDIRYKKLFQCILKESHSTFEEKTLIDCSSQIYYVIKMNSTQIISKSNENSLRIWDLYSGKCIKIIYNYFENNYGAKEAKIVKINKTTIAFRYDFIDIILLDITTGKCLYTLCSENTIWFLFKYNKNQLLSATWDFTIRIWDLASRECLTTVLKTTNNIIISIVSETQLVLGRKNDYTIQIWDLLTEDIFKTLKGHTNKVKNVIKLSNTQIASASADKSINIWDYTTGMLLKTLFGHTGEVNDIVKITKTQIASCSSDKSIKIWDFTSRNCLKTLIGHTYSVENIIKITKFQIVSASKDHSIRIWDL